VDDHDEDCDVQTFGNRDLDGDRFFDDACCNQVGSTRVCGLDCDDGSMGVNPVVPEVCNGYDDNCDGSVDAFCGCTQPGLVRACSMDGPGTCRAGTESCAGGSWSACTGVLGATEDYLCDGQDEDCDGNIDEGLTIECVLDVDHDGHRSASMPARETECPDPARMGAPTFGCPAGYTLFVASASADCCDTDSRTYPRAPAAEDWHAEQDACGSWDYNCDGTDEGRITNVSRNPACASGLGGCHCTSGCGRGWQSGTAPACGATARVCDGCVDSGNSCGSNCTDDVLQTCR
jgi:hypothetical protein